MGGKQTPERLAPSGLHSLPAGGCCCTQVLWGNSSCREITYSQAIDGAVVQLTHLPQLGCAG